MSLERQVYLYQNNIGILNINNYMVLQTLFFPRRLMSLINVS